MGFSEAPAYEKLPLIPQDDAPAQMTAEPASAEKAHPMRDAALGLWAAQRPLVMAWLVCSVLMLPGLPGLAGVTGAALYLSSTAFGACETSSRVQVVRVLAVFQAVATAFQAAFFASLFIVAVMPMPTDFVADHPGGPFGHPAPWMHPMVHPGFAARPFMPMPAPNATAGFNVTVASTSMLDGRQWVPLADVSEPAMAFDSSSGVAEESTMDLQMDKAFPGGEPLTDDPAFSGAGAEPFPGDDEGFKGSEEPFPGDDPRFRGFPDDFHGPGFRHGFPFDGPPPPLPPHFKEMAPLFASVSVALAMVCALASVVAMRALRVRAMLLPLVLPY